VFCFRRSDRLRIGDAEPQGAHPGSYWSYVLELRMKYIAQCWSLRFAGCVRANARVEYVIKEIIKGETSTNAWKHVFHRLLWHWQIIDLSFYKFQRKNFLQKLPFWLQTCHLQLICKIQKILRLTNALSLKLF
jgi:hypothetical protein